MTRITVYLHAWRHMEDETQMMYSKTGYRDYNQMAYSRHTFERGNTRIVVYQSFWHGQAGLARWESRMVADMYFNKSGRDTVIDFRV